MITAPARRRPVEVLPHRRRRWPAVLAVSLVIALAGAITWALWFSPLFALTGVSVTGAGQASVTPALEQQVRDRAAADLGTPLVRVDLDGLEQQLAAIPEVAGARVERRWPHSLAVTIEPRRAVAVTQANDAWYSLDASGVPFSPSRTRPRDLLALQLATPGRDDPSTLAALQVARDLPAGVRGQVSSIRAASPYRIEVLLTDRRTVVWGDASAGAAKAKVLPVVLQRPGTVFDLSDPTMVTVR